MIERALYERSLGAAPSNPDAKVLSGPSHGSVRDGEVAPSDWHDTWIILGWRLAVIAELSKPVPTLVFDSHDQARII